MDSRREVIVLKTTLILLFIFFLPFNLHAKKLFVKIAFGLASGGNVNDTLVTKSEYYDYISMSEGRESKLGQDIYLEFIYQVNSFISFSIGNGYISKMLVGRAAQFDPPESIYPFNPDFTLTPEFSSSVIPVCLSAILSFPVTSSAQANFYGGMGYYLGYFESRMKWEISDPESSMGEPRSWNFKGHASTFGYHIGGGFDINLSSNLYLSFEALYRIVEFKRIKSSDLESSGIGWTDITFFILRFFGGDSFSDFDYRVSKIGLSGVSCRTGLKFRF